LIAGLILIPIILRYIGLERFGILTLIWALIGYFAIFDMGIGRALTYEISRLIAAQADHEIPAVVRAGTALMAVMGAIGAVVLALLAQPLANEWLNVNEAFRGDTAYAIVITAFAIPLVTITSGLRGVLEAYGEFREANLLKVTLGVGNFAMPLVAVLIFGPTLLCIAVSLALVRFFALLPHIYFVFRKFRHLKSKPSAATSQRLKYRLLSFGGWMTVSNIVGPLMVTADRFLISYLLGASVVAYYTVPFDVLMRLLVIPAALTVALFPRLTNLFGRDVDGFRALYNRSSVIVLVVLAPICGAMIFGSKWGLTVWLGEDFALKASTVASIICVGIFFNGLAQLPHAAVQASGDVKAPALLHIAEFVLYVPILFAAVLLYDLKGAAIVWTGRAALDLVILRYIAAKKIAGRQTCDPTSH
jgi:O-antigen/teichoic acid export membrane protein